MILARFFANRFSGGILAVFLSVVSACAVHGQTPPPALNPAERWVVEQVNAGKIADLKEKFPSKEDRKLGARFLEDLLTGSKPHRNGVRISGGIFDEAINLTNAQITFEVSLGDCEFNGSATFRRTNFAERVSFSESVFKKGADFNSVRVGTSVFLRTTVFEGQVDFAWADIARNFEATEIEFKSKDQVANFDRIKVGGTAFFNRAVFEGPVDFRRGHIAGSFGAIAAKFKNKEHSAKFNNMKVGHAVFLRRAIFEGPADFSKVDVDGNFEAQNARFNYQPANSSKTDSGDNFRMLEANSSQENDEVSFNAMKVQGATFFNDAAFKGPVELRYANFAGVAVTNVSWPQKSGSIDMTGMTYKYIRAVRNNESQSHDMILKLIEQSVFSADVYANLEAFFLRHGYSAHADKTFIAGKRRERREHLSGPRFFGSLLLDLLVGYGRRPWQIWIPCVVLVAFAVALFSPNKMEPQKVDATPRIYNRFWYSLGLFLPIVNLESDKVWKPKPEHTFLRNYMRVHILLGWILIPILLAALTGLIK